MTQHLSVGAFSCREVRVGPGRGGSKLVSSWNTEGLPRVSVLLLQEGALPGPGGFLSSSCSGINVEDAHLPIWNVQLNLFKTRLNNHSLYLKTFLFPRYFLVQGKRRAR